MSARAIGLPPKLWVMLNACIAHRSYGPVATVFHLSVDALTVGAFYAAISAGFDINALIFKAQDILGVEIPVSEGAGTFAVRARSKRFMKVRVLT